MLTVKTSTVETALIKGAGHYYFRVYTGETTTLTFRNKPVMLDPGDIVGVRKSASGKDVRLVMPRLGDNYLNLVFSLPAYVQSYLSKNVRFLNKRERDAYALQLVGGRFD